MVSFFSKPSSHYSTANSSSQDQSLSVQVVASHDPERVRSWYEPSTLDVFFLGITIVLSGQYMSWNIGLAAGVYTYLIVYVIVGLAYITFCCCMAEVSSALPFAGGSYGLARCTLGFFPAFLIGCAESLEYIACVAIQANSVCDIIISTAPSLAHYEPLLWLIFFIPTTALQCIGGASFWLFSTAIGIFQFVLLMIYCFGLLGEVDFSANALKDPETQYIGGVSMALHVFPYAAWFFIGVEALNLASNDVVKPKTHIPRGQVACMCALFVSGIWVFLTTVSLSVDGGIAAIAGALAPLNNGFEKLFHIDRAYATLLSLPAQYAGGFGFSWASSKLISSMGRSRLLPPWLGITSERFGTPHWAIITTSTIAYVICLMVYFRPLMTAYILPVCLFYAFFSYTGQCIGYILLTVRYPIKSKCEFKNPFGVVGAVYSLVVWVFGMVAVVGFQRHRGMQLSLVAVVAVGVYYRFVAKKRQTISKDESKILLVVHIAFYNKRKHRNLRKRSSTNTSARNVRKLSKVAAANMQAATVSTTRVMSGALKRG